MYLPSPMARAIALASSDRNIERPSPAIALDSSDRNIERPSPIALAGTMPLRSCLCRSAIAVQPFQLCSLHIYMLGRVANRPRPALKPARRLQRFIIGPAGYKAGGRLSSGPGLQSCRNIYVRNIPHIVTAACILHNTCGVHGDTFNDAWLKNRNDSSQPLTTVCRSNASSRHKKIRDALYSTLYFHLTSYCSISPFFCQQSLHHDCYCTIIALYNYKTEKTF